MIGFGYSMMEPYLTYLRVSADGELVQVENITVGGPTMMHDFNVTENNAIFMDLPAVFDLELAMRGEMPIRWSDDYPARLGVMPRTGTDADVVWYDIDPCYVFHPMNAYEDGDKIVIDVARLDHIWRDGPMDFPEPALHRWTIDTVSGTVSDEQIDDLPAEFPRVPDARVGLKHRYGYMMANAAASAFEEPLSANGAILKYDLETGSANKIDVGKGRLPGESSFVPKADAASEDDGYLMTYVYDANTDSSEYAIFDAGSMSNEPVATVQLPRVPVRLPRQLGAELDRRLNTRRRLRWGIGRRRRIHEHANEATHEVTCASPPRRRHNMGEIMYRSAKPTARRVRVADVRWVPCSSLSHSLPLRAAAAATRRDNVVRRADRGCCPTVTGRHRGAGETEPADTEPADTEPATDGAGRLRSPPTPSAPDRPETGAFPVFPDLAPPTGEPIRVALVNSEGSPGLDFPDVRENIGGDGRLPQRARRHGRPADRARQLHGQRLARDVTGVCTGSHRARTSSS